MKTKVRFWIGLCLASCFLFSQSPSDALAATNVSGEITQNTTWTLAGSPYIVTGDITVRHSSYDYTYNYLANGNWPL